MNLDKHTLLSQLNTLFPDNNQGLITPQRVRDYMVNVLDSTYLKSEVTIPEFTTILNVKDFGAVGDGSTDDTNAFITALDTGKNVYVPEGNYIITSSLNIEPSQKLIGSGSNTLLQFNGSNFTNHTCFTTFERAEVKNISISSDNEDPILVVFELANEDVVLEAIRFMNVPTAVYVNYTSGVNRQKVYVLNCLFSSNGTAIKTDRNNQIAVQIHHCNFVENNITLDLSNLFVEVQNCVFVGTDLVYLRSENIQANPVVIFNSCQFYGIDEAECHLHNFLNNTCNVVKFNSCVINGLIINAYHVDFLIQLIGCDIIRAFFNLPNCSTVIHLADNVIHSDLNIDQQLINVIASTNIIYDTGISRYFLKPTEL